MTTPTATSRSTYTGNAATTVFSTGFYFLAESDVVVKLTLSGGTEIVQTLGVHYTITMPLTVGAVGSVTMLTAPATASTLVIERTVPYTQVTSFRTQGSFSPATHEDRFDRQTFIDQQIHRRVSDLESAGAVGSVVAGNGLTFSSTTLHVGAGDGIQSNADTVEVLYGAAAKIADVAKAAAAAGTSTSAARADHKHDVSTAAAAAGSVAIGNAAGEGSATSLSRSDHVHPVTAPAAPADVTKAAASAGVATTFARADHKHDITTAAAIDLTDSTSAEGAATTLARSNHTHGHGARGGGTLHAAATNAANGFLSSTDKARLEVLGSVHVRAGQIIAQALANAAFTTVIFEVEEYDIGSGYNPVSGVFTAPVTGYYAVAASVRCASTVFGGASNIGLFLAVNASPIIMGGYQEHTAAGTFVDQVAVAQTVLLAAGDTLEVQSYCATARNTFGDNTYVGGSQASCNFTVDLLPLA